MHWTPHAQLQTADAVVAAAGDHHHDNEADDEHDDADDVSDNGQLTETYDVIDRSHMLLTSVGLQHSRTSMDHENSLRYQPIHSSVFVPLRTGGCPSVVSNER